MRVAVVGSVNADLVVEVSRLPRPGATVLGSDVRRLPGGKGGNQAVAAARLGADVELIAAVGDDDLGRFLLQEQAAEGVGTEAVDVLQDAATGTALITVEPGGENTIAVAVGANARLGEASVLRRRYMLEQADALLLQLEVPLEASLAAAQVARATGCWVLLSVAPVPRPVPPLLATLVASSDVVLTNEGESQALEEAGIGIRSDQLHVVTRGARGALWRHRGAKGEVEAHVVDAVDAVGAGDTFAGALAVELAADHPLEQALRRCCVAAALATMAPGAQAAMPSGPAVDRAGGTASPRVATTGMSGGQHRA